MAKRKEEMNLSSTLKFISLASMLTAAASSRAQTIARSDTQEVLGERFNDFLSRVTAEKDSATRKSIVDAFVKKVKVSGHPVVEDSTVYFMYRGNANRASVPSDLNEWSLTADTMKRVAGTNLFYLPKSINEAARFEYKLVIDSTWILDPLNRQQAIGGYGPNSEIWMPHYSPPKEIEYRPNIRHGKLDTLSFKSRLLRRTHPVFVYTPPGYRKSHVLYPCIYVTDGGEYITLALMLNILDNLIADERIDPIVGIFIDPRTDVRDSQTSKRMIDYSLSDTFVNALITELRPTLLKKYRLTTKPEQTAIIGASLGGLISTYAAYRHPEVFGLSASQSPAYWWKDSAIFKIIEAGPKKPIRFYIDTGTIKDAQPQASRMKNLLESKGYEVMYGEYPEGHNWANWRARLDEILTYFWGRR
jgi:enterochelin esterase family protein